MITGILIVLLFVALGIFLSSGRGAFLIAGYNTKPPEERAQYDTAALSRFMGKMMFGFAFSVLLWVLSDVFESEWLLAVGVILFMAILIFLTIYINTGNRFKK